MLDGLLGRGFTAKCKSLIKTIKARVEVIKRRRNAMQKYLKKDIADLISNALDANAYARAEGLWIELTLSSCYDFVAEICDNLPKHLSMMKKQRECPEDCREAISSLIFAAARFADLPELRNLRDIFTEKYGNTLEPFVNKEFVEKLAAKPPTSENKLQLMQEIAKEFSIKWDSKAIEQKIAYSHLHAQVGVKIEETKLYNSRDGAASKREYQDVSSTGRQGLSNDGYMLHVSREEATLDRDKLDVNGRQRFTDDTYRLQSEGRETISQKVNQDVLSNRRWEVSDDQYKQHKGSKETILERENEYTDDGVKPHQARAHTTWTKANHDTLSQQDYIGDALKTHKGRNDTILKRDNLDNSYHERRKNDNGSERQRVLNQGEDTAQQQHKQESQSYKKQNYPTLKPKTKIDSREEVPFAGAYQEAPYNISTITEKANRGAESKKPLPPPYLKPNGGKYAATSDQANKVGMGILANDRPGKAGLVHVDYEERRDTVGPGNKSGDNKVDHQDDSVGERKPKSVRRRLTKPPAGQEYRGNNEGDEVVNRDRNGRSEDIRQGLKHVLENDHGSKDEEKRMDKLLIHYSKKPSKFGLTEKIKGSTNLPMGHHDDVDVTEPQRHRRNNVAHLDPKPVPPPSRVVSLPPEPTTPTNTERAPARATSFQPEMMNPGGHVHPRMPEYDELAARIAALRGG